MKYKMHTFCDFSVWYNNLEVIQFVEALEKQSTVFKEAGIDMLKSAISLPGLPMRLLFTVVGDTDVQYYFSTEVR